MLYLYAAAVLVIITHDLVSGGLVRTNSVLVFGGNGFIGSETVTRLVKQGEKVTIVNRGNWYWDSIERVKPFVDHIRCDRMQTLNNCQPFVEFIKGKGELVFFDAVIDFSGYHPFNVRNAMALLGKRFGLYIYISTDSVYEVCAAKNHSGPTRETDAIRATNPDDISPDEEYGEMKLECEEMLNTSLAAGGPPFIILRLPDVMGARDSTRRWWIYQLWLKLDAYVDKHASVPSQLMDQTMSLVYVSDVADIVSRLVRADTSLHNQAYNLAFKETITLPQLLNEIKNQLGITDMEIPLNTSEQTIYLYPSVTRGPIDIQKAEKYLNWTPTPLKTAISETVQFYERAMTDPKFIVARNEIVQQLMGYLTTDSEIGQISRGILQEYGVDLYKMREEL